MIEKRFKANYKSFSTSALYLHVGSHYYFKTTEQARNLVYFCFWYEGKPFVKNI